MAKPEDYSERKAELAGWPVTIITYRLDGSYHTTIENTDPGAWVVKAEGATKQDAESKALKDAEALMAKPAKRPRNNLAAIAW